MSKKTHVELAVKITSQKIESYNNEWDLDEKFQSDLRKDLGKIPNSQKKDYLEKLSDEIETLQINEDSKTIAKGIVNSEIENLF